MLDRTISGIPVVDQHRLLGMVTETDFLRAYTGACPWQCRPAVERMTVRVFCVAPEEPIHRAWRLMRDKQIHHLVVSRQDELLGILSDRDILAGITWEAAGPKGIQSEVRHIMTPHIATVAPQTTLTDVAKEMVKRRIGALPVRDGGRLVGIITESDLLRMFVASADAD
jgi:CBS domain-containing protein